MPKLLAKSEPLKAVVNIRMRESWHEQIAYLAELQGISPGQVTRELIQIGGEQVGLDLD